MIDKSKFSQAVMSATLGAAEDGIVTILCRRFGVPLTAHVRKGFPHRRATLEWFYDQRPETPCRIFPSKVGYSCPASISLLFGDKFAKNRFFLDYVQRVDIEFPDKTPWCAMCFNWPEIGWMALHNPQRIEDSVAVSDTRISRRYGHKDRLFVLERLDDLLTRLGG